MIPKKKKSNIPLGIKAVIGFFVFCTIMWIVGQGGAVVAYDAVATLALQVPRESVDPVIVEVNRGIGLADVLIEVPLLVVAIIGLSQLKFYGVVASWMALGINMYWPIVAWSKQSFYVQAGIKTEPFDAFLHTTLVFIFLFSAWASWFLYKNCNLFK